MGITHNIRGFTIIEVSLVLGIAAFLMVGILTGIGFAVERQRFTDSVFSTQSFVQYQYDLVTNVVNNRADQRRCSDLAQTMGTHRGMDQCTVLGRAIFFIYDTANQETVIKSYAVIGSRDAQSLDSGSSLDTIKDAQPFVLGDPTSNERFVVPWGGQLRYLRQEGQAISEADMYRTYSVAILRSPKDGSLGVYELVNNLGATPGTPIVSPDEDATVWRRTIGVGISSQITTLEKPLLSCIKNSDAFSAQAALIIEPLGSQEGVSTYFDEDSNEACGT